MGSQFHLAVVTNPVTKYHYVWSVLPEDVAINIPQSVSALHSSDDLKKYSISITQKSRTESMEAALVNQSLYSECPSIFFPKLQRLMTEADICDEQILRYKFLRAMPEMMRTTLACYNDRPLHELAKLADAIHEQTGPTINSVEEKADSDSHL